MGNYLLSFCQCCTMSKCVAQYPGTLRNVQNKGRPHFVPMYLIYNLIFYSVAQYPTLLRNTPVHCANVQSQGWPHSLPCI